MSLTQILAEIYDNIFKFNGTDILILFDNHNTIWLSFNSIKFGLWIYYLICAKVFII